MKKIILSIILTVGLFSALFAQTDRQTRETKIADIVKQLPTDNTASFNKLMGELIQQGDVIGYLAPRLTATGDSDTLFRYAISGLTMYASKETSRKALVAKSLCNAIVKAKSDEIRDFLFIQLQYVAGDESVKTAAKYLNNARLSDAAARVLVKIGSDVAGKALTKALGKTKNTQQLTIVQAIGDMRYKPALKAVTALAITGNASLRKVALHSLAQIADPSSEKILAEAVAKAEYKYEITNALGSYMIFLENSRKEAGSETLLNRRDGLVITQLFKIAADDPSGAYFDKALYAYIDKTGASRNTPAQKLLMLRDGLDIAQTPEQKQTILRQIARTGTFLGLLTAGKYLDDSNNDVQQAAVQAVQTIALANPQYYGTEIIALLNKAIAVNKDPEANSQKQAILKHLSELQQDEGFVSMFNGRDLTGWKGLVENPIARTNMTPKELAEKQTKADEIMRRDWTVKNGILIFDGPAYDNLCSAKDYGDIEMYIDWRIEPEGDAGIYLRGSPQIQIWDIALTDLGAQVGSGGLYNNTKHSAKPLVVADNPVYEWNSFYIKMIGEKVTVYLNGQLVVDNVTLENFWNRNIPIFETGAIELQAHGDRTEYRDIYVREIPRH